MNVYKHEVRYSGIRETFTYLMVARSIEEASRATGFPPEELEECSKSQIMDAITNNKHIDIVAFGHLIGEE